MYANHRPRLVHCSPFTACRVRGCDSGLETSRSDRGYQLQVGNRRWIRCLGRARVATRQGQRVDRSAPFDDGAEAELFAGTTGYSGRRRVGYRRFASAAEALRFAIEELTPAVLAGAALEVGDLRLDMRDMRRLYQASDYPLTRRVPKDR